MSVSTAMELATAGRLTLLIEPDLGATDVARQMGRTVAVVDPTALALEPVHVSAKQPLVVIRRAEALVGVVSGVLVGPWVLKSWRRRAGETGVVLHTRCPDAGVVEMMVRQLGIEEVLGSRAESEPQVVASDPTDTEQVQRAVALCGSSSRLVVEPSVAELLVDLARVGRIGAVWHVPFLVHVTDDQRFVRPFVERDPEILSFFEAYERFVASLSFLRSAEYQLGGRQPRDLRLFADALQMPVLDVARVFRRLDDLGIVVSRSQEEGVGQRPNLVVEHEQIAVDAAAAVVEVNALRARRQTLALSSLDETAEQVMATPQAISGLFASLSMEMGVSTTDRLEAPGEEGDSPTPATAGPVAAAQVALDLPQHLPGLPALARGDLAEARVALGEVRGELATEAVLLGAFRYETIDTTGRATRTFQIPALLQHIVDHALQLDRVPSDRFRATMDQAYPDAFVEMPGPGVVEVYFGAGDLAGTHRFRELQGRQRFEEAHLVGVRAVQARLLALIPDDGDPGYDPGYQALAQVLRLHDGGDAAGAWQHLDDIDLDLDLQPLETRLFASLPDDHPAIVEERIRQRQREQRESFQGIERGLLAAIDARGREDGPGFDALDHAEHQGLGDQLVAFLGTLAQQDPRNPGPLLWLGRHHLKSGRFGEAEQAMALASERVTVEARRADWCFELVEAALRAGRISRAWGVLRRYLDSEFDARTVDHQLDRLHRAGVLGARDSSDLRDLLRPHGDRRRFPRTWRHLAQAESLEPWKKTLQGLDLDD